VSIEPGKESSYQQFLVSRGYQASRSNGVFGYEFNAQVPLEHAKPAFLARRAEEFILKHRNSPWVLYVSFLEPHPPFYGPLDDLHSADEAPLPQNYPGTGVEREPQFYQIWRERYRNKGVQAGGHDLTSAAGWQRLARNYAGLCSQLDQAVGRILWALEASSQADNTVLVFTSDHGEGLGSHSLSGKRTFYEESIRVPMLLRVPFRHSRPQRIERLVSHIDLVPTLLHLLGKRTDLQGESWVPMLQGGKRRREEVFVEWHTTAADYKSLDLPPAAGHHYGRAVISPDGWKLGLYENDNSLLFHRYRDPLEMQNLFYRPESAAVIRRLRPQIETWQRDAADDLECPRHVG